jgi:hypothetical protein
MIFFIIRIVLLVAVVDEDYEKNKSAYSRNSKISTIPMIVPDKITPTMAQLKIHQIPHQQCFLNQMIIRKIKSIYLIN